jgi:hypothetical protein
VNDPDDEEDGMAEPSGPMEQEWGDDFPYDE